MRVIKFSFRRYLLARLSRKDAGVETADWNRLHYSYATNGEDVIARSQLREPTGFYVDIGAFHPVQSSNTYLFYRKGWRGIAVDANPRVVEMFRERRPKDITLHCAVSETEGTAEFNVMDMAETSHLQGAGVEKFADRKPASTVKVQCRRLDAILKEHLPAGQKPDFLSVDTEGHEMSVLKSNDWNQYRPRLIAVEDFAPKAESEVCQFLAQQGYKHLITARITRFFVPKELDI